MFLPWKKVDTRYSKFPVNSRNSHEIVRECSKQKPLPYLARLDAASAGLFGEVEDGLQSNAD